MALELAQQSSMKKVSMRKYCTFEIYRNKITGTAL